MRILSLALIVCCSSPRPALAQEDLNVLSPSPESRRMLYNYLLKEAKVHFDRRREAIAALKTPADVEQRQKQLHHKFLQALGDFPDQTPLNATVTGKEQRDGYRIEKVIYESRPNHHVTAILYLPEGKPPFPGVLVPCGHSANGKAAETYQRISILLAKNGLAALCYDPIGQGERSQLLAASGKPAIAGSTSEHTMVGVGALLVGRNTASYRIWDGIRSLDYLASRPEIDPQRLGCTGNSGGGTLTAYLMALEPRIVAAAPSCYLTSLERLFETIGPQDAEQNITGQVAFGIEHADYVTLRAPRPTLICVGTRDYFDIHGAWTSFREAKGIYGILGHGERVDLFEYNDTHGFSKPRREAALRWMRRWLLNQNDAPTEPDFPIAADADIQCTRTGQVLEDFKGVSAFDLNALREKELARLRRRDRPSGEALARTVRQLLALPGRIAPARPSSAGELKRDGYVIRQLSFDTEPGICVAGLLFVPEKPARDVPLVVYLHGEGKSADAAPQGAIAKLVQAGQRVLALDLRGQGETAPAPAKGPNYFGVDQKEAFLALHLNRPLLGQRVYDLLAVLEGMPDLAGDGVHLVGVGSAGPIALHAAVVDGRIRQLSLRESVISWSAVVRTPISINQLTNVVPRALEHYDLPDLAAALAPRRLAIRAAVDPAGKPVTHATLDAEYAACREAYRQAEANLVLEAN
jgi:cephalosporin-C deacetylase-like acetyl esterase